MEETDFEVGKVDNNEANNQVSSSYCSKVKA
jgi:hypothetical protein